MPEDRVAVSQQPDHHDIGTGQGCATHACVSEYVALDQTVLLPSVPIVSVIGGAAKGKDQNAGSGIHLAILLGEAVQLRARFSPVQLNKFEPNGLAPGSNVFKARATSSLFLASSFCMSRPI